MNRLGLCGDKSLMKAKISLCWLWQSIFSFCSDRHGSRNYRTGRLKLCGVGRAYKNVKHACRRVLLVPSVSLKSRKSWLFVDDGRALEVNSRVNMRKRVDFHNPFEASPCERFHPPDQCFCLSLSLFNFASLRVFHSLEHIACKATDWVNVCTLRRIQSRKCKMGAGPRTWIIQWFWKGH